ncbi:hypothetical protein [Dysgonomonas gadei]|uniref:Uncharacterized protein n=1 Tax=Dysgonomonas gadei ATCC BAA-286 TaxID=742766 RepID=F5J1B4_9BACT|nr:hypothetical protein [Dysgonomonas gadei]EGK00488.1 hypothetical protein HMPREF9455_03131 [Dysgonomonas gadei ATCC BAA-286]
MKGKKLYTGDVPCPGCGRSTKECRRHYRESICFDCENDLRKYAEIKRRTKEQKDTYAEFSVKNSEFVYLSLDPDYANLISALRFLFELLDTPGPEIVNSNPMVKVEHGKYWNASFAIMRRVNGYGGSTQHPFVIREDIALALDALLTCIEEYSKKTYQAGKKDGANLLKRLGTQEITTFEFLEEIKKR